MLRLDASGFDSYSCPDPLTLCFNTISMHKMLVLCQKKDTIKLSYRAKTCPDYISMSFTSDRTLAHVMMGLGVATIAPWSLPQVILGKKQSKKHYSHSWV